MRKVFIILIVMGGIIGGITQDNLLMSFRLFLDKPITHEINKGEYLSKLSQKYYGSTKYWKELAVINRAPYPDLVFPKETIIVPDFEQIKALNEARSLTKVNNMVKKIRKNISETNAREIAAVKKENAIKTENASSGIKKSVEKESQMMSTKKVPVSENSSSQLLYIFVIAGVAIALGLLVFLYLKHGKKEENDEFILDQDTDEKEDENEEKTLRKEEVYVG